MKRIVMLSLVLALLATMLLSAAAFADGPYGPGYSYGPGPGDGVCNCPCGDCNCDGIPDQFQIRLRLSRP